MKDEVRDIFKLWPFDVASVNNQKQFKILEHFPHKNMSTSWQTLDIQGLICWNR